MGDDMRGEMRSEMDDDGGGSGARGVAWTARCSGRAITSMHQCDAGMREKFRGVDCAIEALAPLLGKARIAREVARIGEDARVALGDARNKYDLIAVRFLVDDRRSAHYFSAISCANIESDVREICAQLRSRIARICADIHSAIPADDAGAGAGDAGGSASGARAVGARGMFARGFVARAGAGTKRAVSRAKSGAGSVGTGVSVPIIARAVLSADELCELMQTGSALDDALARIDRACGYEGMGGVGMSAGISSNGMKIESATGIVHGVIGAGVGASGDAKCANCGSALCMRSRIDDSMICDKCGCIDSSRASSSTLSAAQDERSAHHADVMMSRRGGSHHLRHLKSWMDRLQAIENYEIRACELDRVKQSIAQECGAMMCVSRGADGSARMPTIQCKDVARHIALCGLTHLNKHIPKVIKALGGRAPPIFDYDAMQIIIVDFERIMEIYPRFVSGPGNKPYYPFFISKIVRMRFADNPELMRILNYVTQQGYDTVKKNDHIFEQVCKLAPPQYALKYQPEIE